MQTLDHLMGPLVESNKEIREKFIKQVIVSNVKVPKIMAKNNMTLLVKNLKDDTEEKITNLRSDAIIFPAYRSHKLLQKMEEKELKFKQLQRMKELAIRHRSIDRRNSELPHDYNSLKMTHGRESSQISRLDPKISSTLDHTQFSHVGHKSQMTSARHPFNSGSVAKDKNVDDAGDYDLERSPKYRKTTHVDIRASKILKVSKFIKLIMINYR